MYNKKLNDEWIARLQRVVAGKRVLLVGNAATLFTEPHGKLIDSYDIVVRFGKGVPYSAFGDFLGSRTDVWFFGTARSGMYESYPKSCFKVYTPAQMYLYQDKKQLLVPEYMFNGQFQVYRDFMLSGDSDYIKELQLKVNRGDNSKRLSQGVQGVDFFISQVKTQKAVDLIGFDFFEGEVRYTYDNESDVIPREHISSSWHCPLVSKDYKSNPHSDGENKNEEDYIRASGVTIHPMPKHVNYKRMQKVFDMLRGGKVKLERN